MSHEWVCILPCFGGSPPGAGGGKGGGVVCVCVGGGFTMELNGSHWKLLKADLTCPPWEGDVRGPQSVISRPAALFELEGWSRVDVRDEGPKDC